MEVQFDCNVMDSTDKTHTQFQLPLMSADDTPPRFFKVFISNHSSDSMMIPISYNNELPRTLPKTATLQGTGGCIWKVELKRKRDEVYFEKGWNKFVTDNSLNDGDFLTFVYNGDNIFEVSIYGLDGCKEIRAVTDVVDVGEDSVLSLSSEDTEPEMVNTISKNKGKSQVVEVEDESEDEEDSVSTDSDTCSEFTVAKTIPKSRNKGKKKKKVVESSYEDSDYNEDSSDLCAFSESSNSVALPKPKEKRERVTIKKIKDPEKYMVDPKNVYFETNVKNRKYELLVHAQLVKDYDLKFKEMVYYIDHHKDGKLLAKTTQWKDHRVCIKKWQCICDRNKLKKGDGILCELKRKEGFVYAVRIHIVREKDL
ncbi:unnamed protein product [Eruca vesicaria subsp. sativa]|uniref:TF-B3 domain-containing protein n=1 Tax=Eruca vesicaria subsp. sativa TaxID=29727 RepID=A0ABC8JIZ1_ERUVS|nr:unnamed protein product [Eruca vesicaria subsp. sativa]